MDHDALRALANRLTGRQIEALFAVRRGDPAFADPLADLVAMRMVTSARNTQILTELGASVLDVVELLGRFVPGLGIVKRTPTFLYTASTMRIDKLDFAIVARRDDEGNWHASADADALREAFPALSWIG